ncbi:MAG: glycosyltransferase [Spirochaetota bacterium]
MKDLVSICIPLYNSEKYILETLKSVTQQDYDKLEIVICDDCSSDSSFEKVKNFINSFGKSPIMFRLHENKTNLGMTENWNHVIEKAKGEYIKLMGGDDILAPNCISKQVKVLKELPEISLVTCKKRLINSSGRKLFAKGFPGAEDSYYGREAAYKALNIGGSILGEPVTGLFRKKDFLQVSGYDPAIRYHADMDLWIRLLLIGNYYYIKEPLISFRIHKASATVQLKHETLEDFTRMFQKYQKEEGMQSLDLRKILKKVKIMTFLRSLVTRLLA